MPRPAKAGPRPRPAPAGHEAKASRVLSSRLAMPRARQNSEADFLFTLSEPARLTILRALAEGPKSVGQLAELLRIAPAGVSPHLARLTRAGLVVSERDRTAKLCSLAPGLLKGGSLRLAHPSGLLVVLPLG